MYTFAIPMLYLLYNKNLHTPIWYMQIFCFLFNFTLPTDNLGFVLLLILFLAPFSICHLTLPKTLHYLSLCIIRKLITDVAPQRIAPHIKSIIVIITGQSFKVARFVRSYVAYVINPKSIPASSA